VHKLRTTLASLAAMALTASLAVAAVAAEEEAPADDEIVGVYGIEDMTWLLTGLLVEGEMVELPDGAVVSLRMEDGDAGGSGGCNSYFTSYELDGFELTFGPIGSTMMACLPPLMDLEQAYFANLQQVAAYQSGGIQMALLDAEGDPLLGFDLAPEATIVGSWVATGINDQQGENAGVVSSAITSAVTAEFAPDGDLAGFDGCNDYFTTYELDGDAISIDPMVGQTRMACPSDELAEQSAWYVAALANAATWSVDPSGRLELRDEEGSLQVSYAPGE
jgi:heat shock protein HslJ